MKRKNNIIALLKRADSQLEQLKKDYNSSLEDKAVSGELKIDIKNLFENLRSCLDYLARDIYEFIYPGLTIPKHLYFPIRHTQAELIAALDRDFPCLRSDNQPLFQIIDKYRPYNDSWLGHFNRLNNDNKHQDLVEQTRTESKRVTVSRPGGGSVSWGNGVRFGPGVSVMGAPIDPRTQMPVPNQFTETNVTIWVDFKFRENGLHVIPFLSDSVEKVKSIFEDVYNEIGG